MGGLKDFSGNNDSSNNNGSNANNGSGIPNGMPRHISPNSADVDPLDYLIDYNEKYKNAGTNVLFRDELVQQTLAVLIGKTKPNALLIGSAGVGKTKIAEDIAYRIANNDPLIPTQLKGYTIYELPLSNIIAGSSMLGQFEAKLKSVIDFVTDPKSKAILFIDEIHVLVSSNSQTYGQIAQILKPALARSDMKVIGATTLQEASNLADDPALNRRFSRLIVDELSQDQTVEILKQARPSYMTHYMNKFSLADDMLRTVVVMADEYSNAGQHRPDNALTLLDRTISDAIINREVRITQLKGNTDPAMITALQALQANPIVTITDKHIMSTAIKLATGNNKREALDFESLADKLTVIKGQDEAIAEITKALKRYDLSLFPKVKPLTFLFPGSSGVGKTETVKIIAKEITGLAPITLNMTEYHTSASINRIIGAPAGYVGSDSHAELPFDCLESNPYQVILLDEFEKCDKSVQRLFMSAFDEGHIKTNKGKIVDFSKAIIIVTTNANSGDAKKAVGFDNTANSTDNTSRPIMVKELSKWFDLELLNRFQFILPFNHLSEEIYKDIIANKYRTEVARIKQTRRITIADELANDDLDKITKDTYVREFGARPAGKAVQEFIESTCII